MQINTDSASDACNLYSVVLPFYIDLTRMLGDVRRAEHVTLLTPTVASQLEFSGLTKLLIFLSPLFVSSEWIYILS